jgi:hypothetical protein
MALAWPSCQVSYMTLVYQCDARHKLFDFKIVRYEIACRRDIKQFVGEMPIRCFFLAWRLWYEVHIRWSAGRQMIFYCLTTMKS